MTVPLQVTFKGMEKSEALEQRIREKVDRLAHLNATILRCHVTVEAPHRHHHKGKLYRAHVELHIPKADIVVTHEGPQDHGHEDPYVAVRDAFAAVTRQLQVRNDRQHGRVKHHEMRE